MTAAIYDTEVSHVRTTPLRNAFTYRSYQWLVDLDRLPRVPLALRPLARFEARDHVGDPAGTLRGNLDAYLVSEGVDLQGGQILMLANARTFGYVFNPLSVFWCFGPDGGLVCVVAEVHNTYGGRHCYLLRTDTRGRARTAKQFYVSPFYPVDGEYQMSLPVPGEELALTITLHRDEGRPFVATVRGRRRPATSLGLLRAAVGAPWVTAAVALRIRSQGVRLWLRRLPVVPRPARPAADHAPAHVQETVR
ncbi:MAG TPA: DUF1365 domain-containing protein [Actinomycetes bacterium]